ncbi:recombination-associated protein RdgC [Comamonas sp. JNW]|uniref:recombination-associated protein RdgC n=1 Tax=unclassified Comamonas TaxID=2638500 RepID=UPI000DE7713C|nr:recombination-associated protein RdgC [Comamonas sp. JNW]PWB19131.1 recombination-associated protein RdgC [Comamonas sp. JNW]
MFKNMIFYRISETWQPDLVALDTALAKQQFEQCGATQEKSTGWVPPRGEEHGAMVESVGGQWILRLMSESKMLPASVLNRKVDEKLAHIEAQEGRKPGKKEKQELKDECKLDLLPMAFTKQGGLWIWIDPQARLLVLDTSSQGRADEVITMLVEASPGFAVALIDTQNSPQGAMSAWLHSYDAPAGFSIDQECELKSADESKAVVRYARHPLGIDEIREHIDQGKLPTKLALTWDDRVSFVLTEGLQLKKVALLDVVMEGASEDGGFDADVAIATGEFSQLIPDLIQALGGEGRTELGQLPDRGDKPAAAAREGAAAPAKPMSQGVGAAKPFQASGKPGGMQTGPKSAPVDQDPDSSPF